jgi:hypothetical protein
MVSCQRGTGRVSAATLSRRDRDRRKASADFGEAPEQFAEGLESITGTPFLLGMDTLNAPGIREVVWNSTAREISLCG